MVSNAYELFDLGDFKLQSDVTLPAARLAYKTYGSLNAQRNNAIVFPCAYNGLIAENEARIGGESPLDPAKYFINVSGLFRNNQSTSPSNAAQPFDGPHFPEVTINENVRAHHRLGTERFGVKTIKL